MQMEKRDEWLIKFAICSVYDNRGFIKFYYVLEEFRVCCMSALLSSCRHVVVSCRVTVAPNPSAVSITGGLVTIISAIILSNFISSLHFSC